MFTRQPSSKAPSFWARALFRMSDVICLVMLVAFGFLWFQERRAMYLVVAVLAAVSLVGALVGKFAERRARRARGR